MLSIEYWHFQIMSVIIGVVQVVMLPPDSPVKFP
jgi:hypothetical protein